MPLRFSRRLQITASALAVFAVVVALAVTTSVGRTPPAHAASVKPFCGQHPALCTETVHPWNAQGQYTGHDEPSLLFYSNTAGAGNSNLYQMTLPSDPPTAPND